MIILIEYVILFVEDNVLFEFIKDFITLFIIVMNFLFHVILTRNNLNKLIHLIKKLRLGLIINLKINEYYYLDDFEKVYKLIFKLFK